MRTLALVVAALSLSPLVACTESPPHDPEVTISLPTSYVVTSGGGPTASATQAITVWVGAPPGMGRASSATASVLAGPVCAP